MKYLLLFALVCCNYLAAQPSIEFKPGRTDSARWQLVRVLPDSTQVTYLEPYDTLPNVLEFGKVLYTSGGFIGGGRIPRNEDFYTDQVVDFISGFASNVNPDRFAITQELIADGGLVDYIAVYDTLTNYELVGTWTTTSQCGFGTTTIVIQVDSPTSPLYQLNAYRQGEGTAFSGIFNVGRGVVSLSAPSFGFDTAIVRIREGEWRGVYGCKLTKQ